MNWASAKKRDDDKTWGTLTKVYKNRGRDLARDLGGCRRRKREKERVEKRVWTGEGRTYRYLLLVKEQEEVERSGAYGSGKQKKRR